MAESSKSESNEENELTMCDVLEEEQELEDDANAVLGGSDDTNCSYEKGYVARQALYACMTCSADDEPSGVCLACSYKCHDGHEVVELYTKRNFRCDCGNSKFPEKTCSLKPDKDPINFRNKYNQNFKGLYCNCSRPYPDLDDNIPDEMIQCVMCEDWYHGRHIGCDVPEDYFEMICSKCMESHKFLYLYLNKFHYVNVTDDNCKENGKYNGSLKTESIEVLKVENGSMKKDHEPDAKIKKEESSDPAKVLKEESSDHAKVLKEESSDPAKVLKEESSDPAKVLEEESSDPAKVLEEESSDPAKVIKESPDSEIVLNESKSQDLTIVKNCGTKSGVESVVEEKKANSVNCILCQLVVKPDGITSGAAFWPENWRKELCYCSSCICMYAKYDCTYLLNLEDTILAYEERGKSAGGSQYDKGLTALSQLDRVKQMEAIRAYTNMKGQLKEYLKEFANKKRTVCESDIKEFFDRMRKRQRISNGVPHFCR